MTLRLKVSGFIAGIIGFLSFLSCGNGEQTEQRVVNRPGNADVVFYLAAMENKRNREW